MIIKEKLELIKTGKLTAEENIAGFLAEIDKNDKKGEKINSFLQINENALEEAKEIDARINYGKRVGRLAGLAIAVKSNINVYGMNTSCASLTLKDYKAGYDASVIEKIKKENGIIIGMTNMDEFACGSSGETSAFGPTKNPAALELIPGGSSSGSAAALAANFCDLALGSDTGGSIRNPASHCGVIGVKPTYGLVSRYGLIDLSMSFDQIGPLARDVEGARLLLDVIKGRDEKDPTSYETEMIKGIDLKNIKIGIIDVVGGDERIKREVEKRTEEVVKKNGWQIEKIKLEHIELAIQAYYPIVYVEFFSSTRKFDGRRYGRRIEEVAGPEVLRRTLGGNEISKAEYHGLYYRKALKVKEIIKREFKNAFKQVDCIIVPVVPRLPHKIGSKLAIEEMYGYDRLTVPANLAEICAISVPEAKIDNIPVGLQILCPRFNEAKMFSIAKEFVSKDLKL